MSSLRMVIWSFWTSSESSSMPFGMHSPRWSSSNGRLRIPESHFSFPLLASKRIRFKCECGETFQHQMSMYRHQKQLGHHSGEWNSLERFSLDFLRRPFFQWWTSQWSLRCINCELGRNFWLSKVLIRFSVLTRKSQTASSPISGLAPRGIWRRPVGQQWLRRWCAAPKVQLESEE